MVLHGMQLLSLVIHKLSSEIMINSDYRSNMYILRFYDEHFFLIKIM